MSQQFFGGESAVFFTLGEVQENHARHIGGLLQLEKVQIVPLQEAVEAIPTLDIPYPHETSGSRDYLKVEAYQDERSKWLKTFLKEVVDLHPKNRTSLHVVQEASQFNPATRRHWSGILGRLRHVKDYPSSADYSGHRSADFLREWKYTPFTMSDTRITGDVVLPTSIVDHPIIKYELASATYTSGRPHGSPEDTPPELAIAISFDYPIRAHITRTAVQAPRKRNDDGDYVEYVATTSRLTRSYAPEIPDHLKGPIMAIRRKYDLLAQNARNEDEFMYEMGGDMHLDIQCAAELAPLHNLI